MKTHPSLALLCRSLWTGSLLLTLPSLTQAKEEWLSLLPAETVAVITVKNVPELVADWDKSSIGGFLADPAVEKWLAPSYEDGVAPWDKFVREASGDDSLREDVSNYPGASMLVFQWPDEDSDSTEPIVTEFSEMTGKEAECTESRNRYFEVQQKKDESLKAFTKELEGEEVHYLAADEEDGTPWKTAWTLVNGVLIQSNDRAYLAQAIAGVKNGGSNAAPEVTASFKRLQEIADGEGDLALYIDTGVLLEKMNAKLAEEAANGEAAANPFNPQMFMGALSLDEIRGIGLSLNLRDEASQVDFALLHKESPQGLLVRLLHGVDTQVELPGFVPADAITASVSRWSFLRLYDDLFAALNKLGPMVGGMVQMQLGSMEQELGIKLRDDLFATLDDQIVSVSVAPKAEGATSDVTGIKLKDAARFSGALETLKGLAGNGLGVFEASDFAGYQVWKMKATLPGMDQAGAANEFAYTIAKDHFLVSVGAPDALHKILTRMNDPSGEALWDSAEARTAMDSLPANRTGVGVSHGSELVKMIFSAMAQAQEAIGSQAAPKAKAKGKGKGKGKAKNSDEDDAEGGSDAWFDPAAMPDDEVFARYFGISSSASYSHPDAAHFRAVALPAEGR